MNNDTLFNASLEAVHTDKCVEKYQRFKNDFRRVCLTTLDNTQEWVKAELPLVTEYIDVTAVKDELKQSKISKRRKYLLSALLFEKNLRNSIEQDNAVDAAVMALQMVNQIWQAKVELHGLQPMQASTHTPSDTSIDSIDDTREKILATLIEKGEKRQQESQIESKIRSKIMAKAHGSKEPPVINTQVKKPATKIQKKPDLWDQKTNNASQGKNTKPSKKKKNGMLSKVKTKLPLKRKAKNKQAPKKPAVESTASPEDSLLDDPNRSSIMVNPGFQERLSDSMIQSRRSYADNPEDSGVTIRKVQEKKVHEKKKPGMQTVVMKLASSAGRKPKSEMSVPEQCQDAINILTQQFPGYDMVAIRHMAAEKVGVSPQYIENLNILPD